MKDKKQDEKSVEELVIAVTVCFVVFKLLLKIFDIVDFYI